jgi:hypothetical protein
VRQFEANGVESLGVDLFVQQAAVPTQKANW